jgi:Uma2 family endonuclease
MTVQIEPERQSVILDGVSWDYYSQTLKELGLSRSVRITFDEGRMEIVTTSNLHERIRGFIARFIATYALEADIPLVSDGSLTLRRATIQKGLEPDDCYYVNTPVPPASAEEFDLNLHPPPDLAIEVEVSIGVTPKRPIYAALGVAEIWRWDGRRIISLHLRPDGGYEEQQRSLAFPKLPLEVLSGFVRQAIDASPHEAVRAFRDWVREHVGG